MHQYKLISKIGEGTFSEVLKAQSLKTGELVAIKCMKNLFQSIEQVQKLREIQAIKQLSPNPNVIRLIEVLYDEPTGRLALVFQLMQQNLYESIRGRKTYMNTQKVQHYMFQLLKSIEHMHKRGIFHRDIKPENILLTGETVKLADFGSCKGIYSQHPYTEYISTRWYRAPQCLLTDGYYDHQMDLWGVGCVMFEIMTLFPIFPGSNELDQVHRIHNILGTPKQEILDRFQQNASHMEFKFPSKKGAGLEQIAPSSIPQDALDLISKLLIYDPEDRITAQEALKHPFFKEIHEMERNDSLNSSLNVKTNSPTGHKAGSSSSINSAAGMIATTVTSGNSGVLGIQSHLKENSNKYQLGNAGIIPINSMNGGNTNFNGSSPKLESYDKKNFSPVMNNNKINSKTNLQPGQLNPYQEALYLSAAAAASGNNSNGNGAGAGIEFNIGGIQNSVGSKKAASINQNPYLQTLMKTKSQMINQFDAKIQHIHSKQNSGDEEDEKPYFPPIKNNSSNVIEKLSVNGLQATIQPVHIGTQQIYQQSLGKIKNSDISPQSNSNGNDYLILGQKAVYIEKASKANQL